MLCPPLIAHEEEAIKTDSEFRNEEDNSKEEMGSQITEEAGGNLVY